MTAVATVAIADRTLTRSSWRAVVALGWREGRRILLSPVFGLVLGIIVLMGGVESFAEAKLSLPSARTFYDIITFFTALYLGLLVYISAHLVTSSARRTGAEPQLAASALSARQRRAGLCLGVLLGPGLLAIVLMVTAGLLGNGLEVVSLDGFGDDPPMSALLLLQLGLMLVGGGMFAVMWATWLRFPGSLPLGFVVLVFGTGFLLDPDRSPINSWPWFAPYISAPQWFDDGWTQQGSHGWHAVYLVGLCVLAFCATMLRDREHRTRWICITSGVLVATTVAGALQLS